MFLQSKSPFWSRIGLAPPPRPLTGEQQAELRARGLGQVRALTALMLIATLVDIASLDIIFWSEDTRAFLTIWTIVALAVVGYWAVYWSRDGEPRFGNRAPAAAVRRLAFNMFLIGAVWSVPMVVLFDGASEPQRVVLIASATGMLSGGAIALATVWQAALFYELSIIAPGLYVLLSAGEPLYWLLGLLSAFFLGKIYYLVRERGRLLVETYLTAADLREQGQVISLLLKEFEENATDWLFEIDARGRIQRCGERLAQLLGRPATEVVGFDLMGLIDRDSPEGRAGERALLSAAASRAPVCEMALPVMIDGVRRWWSITAKPVVGADGGLAGYRGVGSDVTAAKRAEAAIERMARFDALTGLANRSQLDSALGEALARNEALAVVSFDLDRFKNVNDTLGHHVGDKLLQAVAQRLRAEAGPNDVVARLGGDEFIVMRRGADRAAAEAYAAKVVAALSERYEIDGYSVLVGASAGVALSPLDGRRSDALLRNSDLALYRAKTEGKGLVRFFAAEMDAAMQARRRLEIDLRDALQREALDVHFQPVVEAATGKVIACEALARWTHAVRGRIPPTEFIPVAEETGLIMQLGDFVLRAACREAARWPHDVRVAVNLSAVQFKSDDLAGAVERALRDGGLAPERLELEITESLLIEDRERAVKALAALRALGVRISLDDFGTGYSSLAYLSSFPFDKIKIDRSFVRDVPNRSDAAAIIRAIASIAATLGMGTTAEGVETEPELHWLMAHGCGEVQGFLFSAPVPPERLRPLLDVASAAGRVRLVGQAA